MLEIFLVAVIVVFMLIYTGKLNTTEIVENNKDILLMLKEPDYDFLLYSKYGDRVYDSNEVFMQRFKKGGLVAVLCVGVFVSKINIINIIISILVGFLVFKLDYINLKSYYKKHLNEVDSLLPYYLKGLEVLIQHYTVPVALAKSISDAPDVFKSGLKILVSKIEAGDSSIQPYMDFANMYPVRDSVRMMRLLYRLGLGEQEKKHDQLIAFSKSVSSLQQKARENKYKNRLGKMESMTMIMLVCTGGGGMLLLLVSMLMLLSNI